MLQMENILIARDFSNSSNQALQHALDLARQSGAALHVVYAAPAPGDPDNVPPEADVPDETYLERLKDTVATEEAFNTTGLDVTYAVARGLATAPALITYAREHHVDLIVTGTHARTGLRRFFLGSVAEKVARTASCPVSIVNPKVERAPARTAPAWIPRPALA